MLERAIALDPHFKSLELLGEALMRLGRYPEAIIPLAAATTLNRGVRAPSLLAEVFLALGEADRAEEIATLALSRDPNNGTAQRVRKAVASRCL